MATEPVSRKLSLKIATNLEPPEICHTNCASDICREQNPKGQGILDAANVANNETSIYAAHFYSAVCHVKNDGNYPDAYC